MPLSSPDPLFDTALRTVLAHEGGYGDDVGDPGGATNFGISLRFARTLGDLDGDGCANLDLDRDGDIDADDIRRMTREDAARIYRSQWWDRHGYSRFPAAVAVKTFDLAVNAGAVQAHKILQRALRAADGPVLIDDGVLGPKTLEAVTGADPAALVVAIRAEAAGFYRALVAAKPAFEKFQAGWLNRAYS
jgi:lysozyme family protein